MNLAHGGSNVEEDVDHPGTEMTMAEYYKANPDSYHRANPNPTQRLRAYEAYHRHPVNVILEQIEEEEPFRWQQLQRSNTWEQDTYNQAIDNNVHMLFYGSKRLEEEAKKLSGVPVLVKNYIRIPHQRRL
ncbi:MAG: hypothetical protein KGJ07_08795, partial [Patescibacteria group bacterium]|nr:hypothetical protein [Patescibacteria group bacterium]